MISCSTRLQRLTLWARVLLMRQDSYRHLQQSGLEAIPLWVFTVRHAVPNPDATGAQDAMVDIAKPYVVSGSSSVKTFAKVFDTIRADATAAAEMRSRAAKM